MVIECLRYYAEEFYRAHTEIVETQRSKLNKLFRIIDLFVKAELSHFNRMSEN